MKTQIILAVIHLGLTGLVEIHEPLGACKMPPLNVPVTINAQGCYVRSSCKGEFDCAPAPFKVVRWWRTN